MLVTIIASIIVNPAEACYIDKLQKLSYTVNMPRSRPHREFDVPTEYEEQVSLVEELRWRGLTPVHIPNGGQRSHAGHAIAKNMGEQAGFPDLMIIDRPPNAPESRVFIEMKRRKGGRVSDKQAEWHNRLNDKGDIAIIAKGAEDAINQLKSLDLGWSFNGR